jgi:hypothetical protein
VPTKSAVKEENAVADIDDSNPKKEQSPEDMSLADLLAGDEAEPVSTARRVDSRDDEPDSGMVRLADMVAKSSPDQARIPSIIPPAARTGGAASTAATSPQTGGFHQPAEEVTGLPSILPLPHKAGFPTIIAVATVVVIVGAAVAFFLIQKKSQEESERIMQLRIQVEELEKKKQRDEMQAKLEELQLKEREAQKRAEEERAAAEKAATEKAALEKALAEKELEEQAEEEAKDEEEAKPAKKGKKNKGKKVKKKAKKAKTAASTKASAPEKTEAPAPSGDELDALIGGSQKGTDKSEAKKESGGGQPTKADVKAAMAPVAAKAQSCSKYSTGTVQLKITVNNSGKVQQSQAIGSFANTTAGKCVEMIARTAKFPKFTDPSFTFTYPITLK